MIIGVVGLGLIGGSFAKAYHAEGHKVYAWNRSKKTLGFALISGDIDEELTEENVSECDLVVICLYPQASIEWIRSMAPHFGEKPVVIDACGTKRDICETCFKIAEEHGFTFVGGHPMGGTKYSGFKYAKEDMFRGKPMLIVPPRYDDIELYSKIKELLSPLNLGKLSITTAENHDRMIAFTSQLSHIVASAYIKSPTAENRQGFSGGTYKDMTRVAFLNAPMWAEIFITNKDYLLDELDSLIDNLGKYREAISEENVEELTELLADGTRRKERLG
ncbi:MAG: prephenate dehydrogenase/arogenate dehydrogenase family protein [Mogibacterium sp.]|nr:prephenate dehydrogenase/arogenate dehydrogenase family protein [Mogibacterium sp.]